MAWVKLDDAFLDHPKFISAGPLAGYLAITGIAWSNRNLMDGFIPERQVARLVNFEDLAKAEDLAGELVTAGLWERVAGGYRIHDYHDYQPSAEAVRAERRKSAERKQKQRSRERPTGSHSGTDVPVTGAPVTRSRSKAKALDVESLSDSPSSLTANEERKRSKVPTGGKLSDLLFELMVANGCKEPEITQQWLDAERLMITADKRDPAEAERLIRWSQRDSFWKANIHSMLKFRKQYDQLRLKSQRGPSGKSARVDARVRDLLRDSDAIDGSASEVAA